MRAYRLFGQQPRRQLGHGDVAFGLDPAKQRLGMGSKPTATNRATLPRRCQRTRLHLALRQPNRRRWCHPKPTRRRPARLATLDLADNPNPKIR